MTEPIRRLPPPKTCEGKCGVDDLCSVLTYIHGYCLKPADRRLYMELTTDPTTNVELRVKT